MSLALLATFCSFDMVGVDVFILVLVLVSYSFCAFFVALFAAAKSFASCFLVALSSLFFTLSAAFFFFLRAFAARLILQLNLACSSATLSVFFSS
jgi:hypothetical protein